MNHIYMCDVIFTMDLIEGIDSLSSPSEILSLGLDF